jgi:hypothetical protein
MIPHGVEIFVGLDGVSSMAGRMCPLKGEALQRTWLSTRLTATESRTRRPPPCPRASLGRGTALARVCRLRGGRPAPDDPDLREQLVVREDPRRDAHGRGRIARGWEVQAADRV